MGLEIGDGDTFVFSSKTIPGNEISVNRVINNLSDKGVIVKYSDDREFHVSGHSHEILYHHYISQSPPYQRGCL